MKKIIALIFFILLCLSTFAFGANVYIDPDCGTPGDGSGHTCGDGAGTTDPFNSWADVTFNAANDYYQKCATTDPITARFDVDTITAGNGDGTGDYMVLGAYYGAGTIGVAGAKPIISNNDNDNELLRILDSQNVEVTNLQFQEGNYQIWLGNADYNKIHDSVIGDGATTYGVRVQSGSDFNEIYDNTIDSDMPNEGQVPYDMGGTLFDAVQVHASDSNKIYGNTMVDWGHTTVLLEAGSDNNEVYYNYITGTNSGYVRAWAIGGQSNNNKIYNNTFLDCPTRSQLMGDGNEIYNNIWDTVNGVVKPDTAQGIIFTPTTDGVSTTNNKIYNNTFYNTNHSAIELRQKWLSANVVTGNEITNNAIYLTNTDAYCIKITPYGTLGADAANINTNTIKNNTCYVQANTDIFTHEDDCGDGKCTAAEFDAVDGAGGLIDGNATVVGDPKFKDAPGHDFSLLGDSPCVDTADATYAPADDYDGVARPQGGGDDIGALEYTMFISNAVPTNNDTGVALDADMSWTNPTGENTVDVYWKVGACPTAGGDLVSENQAHKTSYEPGTMTASTVHCWRVDVDHDGGTETGTDYTFTTAGGPSGEPPDPSNSLVGKWNVGGIDIKWNVGGVDGK